MEIKEFQTIVNNTFKTCLVCGGISETRHHFPPKCINPKIWFTVPLCKDCHRKLNSGIDYTAKEKRSLKSNLRKIDKSVKNIRRKLLENNVYQKSRTSLSSK